MKKKLSIIIPIYKCENYLSQCIESVLKQSFSDFELILVDDGSPDGCGIICDSFAEKDNRIFVIHKENEGSVLARKAGFEVSKGEYVSFLDSDDWIEEDFYKLIFEKNNNVEMFCCGFTSEYENNFSKKEINSINSGYYSGEKLKIVLCKSLFDGVFFQNGIFPALWCKVIKRELVESVIFSVNPLIKMGDDAAITYPILANVKTIYIDNDNVMYHYRRQKNSLSTSYDCKYFYRLELLYNRFNELLCDNEIWGSQKSYYFAFLITIGFFSEFYAFTHRKIKKFNNIFEKEWVRQVFNGLDEIKLTKDTLFLKKLIKKNKTKFVLFDTMLYIIKGKFDFEK